LNLGRKVTNAIFKLTDHQRLLQCIIDHNVPRLYHTAAMAMRNGASIRAIINTIEAAIEGIYHPRGFGADDFDLALLVYRLGGHNLLYAMNHKLGLPSLRALRNHLDFTNIMPTVSTISADQIIHNITNVVIEPRTRAGRDTIYGVSFKMDEVALEEMAVHFRKSNCIGGLCWKHSSCIDPVLHSCESAVTIAEKLKAGEVHLGKEMSVIAVSCFNEDGTYPILAAPTCKTEDASDMEMIFGLAINCWNHTEASAKVGPLWSFATDGDATRRAAGYKVFVKTELPRTSQLYGCLGNMPGLNLYTGHDEVTLDFDFKHIFKRTYNLCCVCTLIRSPGGITLDNGRIINSNMLRHHLSLLPGSDDTSAQKLLYPDDPQDIPCAVELMNAIICLGELDGSASTNNGDVGAAADIAAIKSLAALLEALLRPFIDISLSLTKQVQFLSKASHMAFSFFRLHRHAFMSSQLYGDTQTMIKNAMFCIAKQQKLNPRAHFFLGNLGDDSLELLFARLRMIGGHNSAMNYQQAIDRLNAATDIDAAFMRNPDRDSGHRRLNLNRAEGVDHIKRKDRKGDLVAGRCDLPSAWCSGHDGAIGVLQDACLPPDAYSFDSIFKQSGIDMHCPFGHDYYPGVLSDGEDEDRSSVPARPVAATNDPECAGQDPDRDMDSPLSNYSPTPPTRPETDDADDEDPLTFEEALAEYSPTDVPPPPLNNTNPLSDSAPPLPAGSGVHPDDFLLYKGRWIHKQSVCRLIINYDFQSKSLNQLERVRGFTKVNSKVDITCGDLTGGDVFIIGDPFLTLLRTDRTLSLALI
ncbi:hypothetical protein BV22DRAFT_1023900, partial [Leucogyrophana mollusca]